MYAVAGTIDHTYRHVNGIIPNGKFWSPEWEIFRRLSRAGNFPEPRNWGRRPPCLGVTDPDNWWNWGGARTLFNHLAARGTGTPLALGLFMGDKQELRWVVRFPHWNSQALTFLRTIPDISVRGFADHLEVKFTATKKMARYVENQIIHRCEPVSEFVEFSDSIPDLPTFLLATRRRVRK